MSFDAELQVSKQSKLIRHILSSRSRQVQPGCIIKIPLQTIFGEELFSDPLKYIYGVVGEVLYREERSTAR